MLTLEYEAKLLPERMEYPHAVGVMRFWSRRFLQLFCSALLAPFGSVLRALLGNADSLRCPFYQLCSGFLCFASLVFPETKCSLRVWRDHKGLLTHKETWHRRKRRKYLRLVDNSDTKSYGGKFHLKMFLWHPWVMWDCQGRCACRRKWRLLKNSRDIWCWAGLFDNQEIGLGLIVHWTKMTMMREVIEWARSLEMRYEDEDEDEDETRRTRRTRMINREQEEDKGEKGKEEKETRREKIKRVNHGLSACKWCLWVIGDRQGRCACHWKFTHLKYLHESLCWPCWAGLFRNQEVRRITDILWRKMKYRGIWWWCWHSWSQNVDVIALVSQNFSLQESLGRWGKFRQEINEWEFEKKKWIRVKRGTDVPKKVKLEGKLR